jgi:hypothetical protein
MEKKDCIQQRKNPVILSRTSETKMRAKEKKQDAFIAIVAYIALLCSAVHYTIFNIKAPSLCC